MSKEKAAENLYQIRTLISQSREGLKRGELTELTGMEDQIATLCEDVLKSMGDDRKDHAQQLDELQQDLLNLREDLVAMREQVRAEIGGLGTHQQATRAYRTADSVDSKPKKTEE